MARRISGLAIAVMVVLLLAPMVQACPMCAEALENGKSGTGQNLSKGIYYSLLFMLSMPFLLTGAFGFAFYRMAKGNGARLGESLSASARLTSESPARSSPA